MIRLFLALLSIVFIYGGCDMKKTMTMNFPKEYHLEGVAMDEFEPVSNEDGIFILGDWLMIYQPQGKRLFRFIRMSDTSFSFEAGSRGHGANEFLNILSTSINPKNDCEFTLLDNGYLKTVRLQEDGTLTTLSLQKTFEQRPVNGYCQCGEKYAIAYADCMTGTESDYEYQIVNLNTRQIRKFSPYPNFHKGGLSQDERCWFYSKSVVANSSKDLLFSSYSFFPCVRLYERYQVLKKEVYIGSYPQKIDRSQISYASGKTCATDKYVYIVSTLGLQVWNWEAEPIALLHMDREFADFVIDSPTQTLYTMVFDEENDCYRIYTYHLPSIMAN